MSQHFDNLSTKILKLIPLSAVAKNGFYLDTNKRFGFGVADKVGARLGGPLVAITANGAINPNNAEKYVITKGGVAAMTLAAPTVTVDDGKEIFVTSNTANAHTVTATGLLQTGAATVDVATFAAFAGAGLTLIAYQGKWNVKSQIGITFS